MNNLFFREALAIDMADKDKMATSASGSGPLATSPVKKGHKRRRTRSHNSSSPSPGILCFQKLSFKSY